ncbi:MAG: hypothetical protein HY613_05220 [Candidatus Rokubacteria bacterium]|nr:hypothetical protein [Candidatus Rokubacteria bacterium]
MGNDSADPKTLREFEVGRERSEDSREVPLFRVTEGEFVNGEGDDPDGPSPAHTLRSVLLQHADPASFNVDAGQVNPLPARPVSTKNSAGSLPLMRPQATMK